MGLLNVFDSWNENLCTKTFEIIKYFRRPSKSDMRIIIYGKMHAESGFSETFKLKWSEFCLCKITIEQILTRFKVNIETVLASFERYIREFAHIDA